MPGMKNIYLVQSQSALGEVKNDHFTGKDDDFTRGVVCEEK